MGIHPKYLRMINEKPNGLYLYSKIRRDLNVLKELTQFIRSQSPGRNMNFAFVETETSLIPDLSLWENIQIETGIQNWNDLLAPNPDLGPLVNLLKEPNRIASQSEPWERFVTSLLKGMLKPTQNLLIDMNEAALSPFLMKSIKMVLMRNAGDKMIYLATNNTDEWMDCAHSVIYRDGYNFMVTPLPEKIVLKKTS